MTMVNIQTLECFGEYSEDSEEVCWGPYPTARLYSPKPFAEIEPADFMMTGYTPEDIVYDEEYLMWDVTSDLKDEPNTYCRINYIAREVE